MPRPPSLSAAREADRLLHDLALLYRTARGAVHACCPGTSAQECEALTLLARDGPLAGRELAAAMGLEKTWASRLVQRLVDRKLARQTPDPADSRRKLVELTARGRAAADRLEAAADRCATSVLAHVPPEERAGAVRALRVLRDAVAAACAEGCGRG